MSINYEDFLEHKKEEFNYIVPPKDYYCPLSWQKGNPPKLSDPNLYEYINIKKETCFWIERKELPTKKVFIPHSFDADKKLWVQKAWDKNRPLFRENYLNNNKKPILLVEGEKAVKFCEANKFISEHYLIMTWSGGALAVNKTNFECLKDRQVTLFPDNDEPGRKAMHEVAFTLIKNKIITSDIKIVIIPEAVLKFFPQAWDIADPFPTGYTAENFLTPGSVYLKDYDPELYKKIWQELEQKQLEEQIKIKAKEIINNYVYVLDRDDFREINANVYLDIKRMDHWYLSLTKKGETMSKRLLKNENLKKVYRVICHPGLQKGVVNINNQYSEIRPGIYLNTYAKPKIISKPGDCSRIVNYYEWLFGKDNWNIISKYIHILIKRGGTKILWVPVYISHVEGAGKGLLVGLVKSLLGYENVLTNVSVEQLVEKHSTIIEGSQLICLNELSFTGYKADKKEVTNRLKSIFTDPFLVINPKNKQNYETPNLCNFMVSSNDDRCLHLERDGRRYFIINIKHSKEEIVEKLNNSGVADLIVQTSKGGETLSYLLNYFENIEVENLSEFIRRAPISEDLDDMVEGSKDEIHKFLDHCFNSKTYIFHNTISERFSGMINTHELIRNLRSLNGSLNGQLVPKFSDYQIETWLKTKCKKWLKGKWTRVIKTTHGRINVWCLEDKKHKDKYISEMTENEAGLVWGLDRHFQTPLEKENYIADFNGQPRKEIQGITPAAENWEQKRIDGILV
jgi:hypothetical protein